MDKLTFISTVMQTPEGMVTIVGEADNPLYLRHFNSGACAGSWAEAYPDKLAAVTTITTAHRSTVKLGERKCWFCSLVYCNDIEREVNEALGSSPQEKGVP